MFDHLLVVDPGTFGVLCAGPVRGADEGGAGRPGPGLDMGWPYGRCCRSPTRVTPERGEATTPADAAVSIAVRICTVGTHRRRRTSRPPSSRTRTVCAE